MNCITPTLSSPSGTLDLWGYIVLSISKLFAQFFILKFGRKCFRKKLPFFSFFDIDGFNVKKKISNEKRKIASKSLNYLLANDLCLSHTILKVNLDIGRGNEDELFAVFVIYSQWNLTMNGGRENYQKYPFVSQYKPGRVTSALPGRFGCVGCAAILFWGGSGAGLSRHSTAQGVGGERVKHWLTCVGRWELRDSLVML